MTKHKTLRDIEEAFDEKFVKVIPDDWNDEKSHKTYLISADPEDVKQFITSQISELLEGLRLEGQNNKYEFPPNEFYAGKVAGFHQAAAELDEKISKILE